MRFLAVIQIDESNSMSFADAKPDADNTIVIGNYRIKAQMDTSQEARLEIENKTTGEYLLYGPANGAVKAKGRKFSHSTLLINKTSGCQGDNRPLPFDGTLSERILKMKQERGLKIIQPLSFLGFSHSRKADNPCVS